MGRINKGILGGFSGKVGNVVGGTWKGIDYMRSKSNRRNFEPTPAQREQQAKFGLAIRFAQTMSGLLEAGFRTYAQGQTGINSAVSYILKNAIGGAYPDFVIVYGEVLVTRGDLPNVLAPTVTAEANSILAYLWNDNSGAGIAKPGDKVILAAYCPDLNQCIYTTGSARRDAKADTLNLATFSGKEVHTYIGCISEDGRNIATSIYTGSVMVL